MSWKSCVPKSGFWVARGGKKELPHSVVHKFTQPDLTIPKKKIIDERRYSEHYPFKKERCYVSQWHSIWLIITSKRFKGGYPCLDVGGEGGINTTLMYIMPYIPGWGDFHHSLPNPRWVGRFLPTSCTNWYTMEASDVGPEVTCWCYIISCAYIRTYPRTWTDYPNWHQAEWKKGGWRQDTGEMTLEMGTLTTQTQIGTTEK